MIKPSKRWLAALASLGIMSVCSMGTKDANANDIIYDDSNVSITSALDRYIASNDDAFLVNSDESLSSDSDAEMTSGSVNVHNEGVNSGNATGSITEEKVSNTSNPDFAGKALVIISDTVNIRAAGDVNSERVGSIGAGGLMTVIEQGGEWSHITSGNCDGYIKNEFIAFGDDAAAFAEANLSKVAVVETSALKLRAGEGEDTECLTLLAQGERYHVISQGSEWTKVMVDETLSGYVSNEYISISYNTTTAVSVEEENSNQTANEENEQEEGQEGDYTSSDEPQGDTTEQTQQPPATDVPVSELGVSVANFALQFVGNPYVYGGTSLTNGADCSGFVMKVYENFGYSLPRTADIQGTVGTEVNLSSLAAGDLVFYDHGTGSIKHVGIYIGNGQIVHASSSTTGIIVSNMYYSTPCKAVRIIY